METCGGRCAVFAGDEEQGYKYAIGEKDGDLRAAVKEFNQSCNGRGGGKPFLCPGQRPGKAGGDRGVLGGLKQEILKQIKRTGRVTRTMEQLEREQVTGSVSVVIFQNRENGYTVFRLRTEEEEITAVGILPAVSPGSG